MIGLISHLGFVRALAEDRENDIDSNCEVLRDQSWVNELDGLVSGEVLEALC